MVNALLGFSLAISLASLIANLVAADRLLYAMRSEAPRLWSQLGEPRGLVKLGMRGQRDFRQIMRDADLLAPAPKMLFWRRMYRTSGAVGVATFVVFFLLMGLAVP